MKLTLANIKELKRKSDSPLTRHVCNYVIDRWGDYDDKKGIFGVSCGLWNHDVVCRKCERRV